MQYKVVKEIRKSKQDYFDKLDRQLSSDNHDPKLFWKTSKQVLNLDKSSSSIPTLKMQTNFSVGRCVITCAFFGKSVKHTFSCSKMYSV